MYEHDEHDDELAFWSRVDGPRTGRSSVPRRTRTPRSTSTSPSRRPAPVSRKQPPAQPANGRRAHHDDTGPITRAPSLTGAIPVIAQRAREAHAADPRVRRLGALTLVMVLAVPVALALRSGNEADATAPVDLPRHSAASVAATTAATAPVIAAQSGTAAAEPPASTVARSPWADVDVDALAPAVPKHPDATVTAERAAVASSVAPAPKVAPAAAKTVVNVNACSKKYTVQPGDAWMLIASKANVSTKAVLQANNATTATMLYPGRSVCLPLNATLSSGTKRPASSSSSAASKPASSSASAAPATTQPPRPANTYSRAQVEAIIRSVWPDQLEDEAVRIATRESNLNPTVRNYCCYGLFQIYYSVHKSWLATIGVRSAADLYDPKVNAYAAYMLYLRSGSFRPWQ